jgi:hypothetical protein
MVMVLAACPIPIPAPAERETLLLVPSKLKLVALGTLAEMVMFGLVLSWLRLMFGPAIKPQAVDDAVFSVPLVVPPTAVPMVLRTVAPVGGFNKLTVTVLPTVTSGMNVI